MEVCRGRQRCSWDRYGKTFRVTHSPDHDRVFSLNFQVLSTRVPKGTLNSQTLVGAGLALCLTQAS